MFRDFPSLEAQAKLLNERIRPNFQGVMVALSGGPDSTALFDVLRRLIGVQKKFELAALHVAYGLRGEESEDDLRHVEALCERHGVPLHVRHVSDDERAQRQGESLQEWARRLRQEEFVRHAADGWAIALGHHLDDLAETVLFRLARGSAPGTLLGMKDWAPPLWRPLLKERKAAIFAYLNRHGLTYRDDRTNAKMIYSRNVIRHQVLPALESLFPGAAERIVGCASDAADLSAWCTSQLASKRSQASERVLEPASAETAPTTDVKMTLATGVKRVEMAELLRTVEPEVLLPRKILDTATAHDGRCLPGGRYRLRQRDAASQPTLEPHDSHMKSIRAEQHRRGVRAREFSAILEPGAHTVIRNSSEEWRLGMTKRSESRASDRKPSLWRISPPKIRTIKRFLAHHDRPITGEDGWHQLEQDQTRVGLCLGHKLLEDKTPKAQS